MYSEPIQTFQMEPSATINYRFKSTFFVETSTPDVWLGSEYGIFAYGGATKEFQHSSEPYEEPIQTS